MELNDVHDPFDPQSPAYDLHQGSLETMQMLDPVPIIVAGSADLPDNPDDLDLSTVPEGMAESKEEFCSDPVHEERENDARESGHL